MASNKGDKTVLTSDELKKLANKLNSLCDDLTTTEQAYLAGVIGLGAKKLAQVSPQARIDEVGVEFDARHLPDLSDVFEIAFQPGCAGRLPGDVGPEIGPLGPLAATSVSVSVGTGGPAVGVGVSI